MSRGGDWPQIVRCKDGWIGLCIFTPQQWDDFADMIGRPELVGRRPVQLDGWPGPQPRARAVGDAPVAGGAHRRGDLRARWAVPRAGGVGRATGATCSRWTTSSSAVCSSERPERLPPTPLAVPESARQCDRRVAPWVTTRCTRRIRRAAGRGRRRLPLDGVTRARPHRVLGRARGARTSSPRSAPTCVKIESPTRPDGMRFATMRPPSDPDWVEYGPTFHGTNPAKRSVAIDFSTPEGRELVLRLVEQADVVVENFTPRVMRQRRARLRRSRSRADPTSSCCACRRSGSTARGATAAGFAQTTEQVSGIAWMTGEADGRGARAQHHRPIAGIHGAFAVLAALEHRDRTGEGQLIEMPMAEVALNVAAEPIVTWSAYGTLLERDGNRGAAARRRASTRAAGDEQWVGAVESPTTTVACAACACWASRTWATDADARHRRGASRRGTTTSTPRSPSGSPGATATTRWTTLLAAGRAGGAGVGPDDPGRAPPTGRSAASRSGSSTRSRERVGYPGTGLRSPTVRQLVPGAGSDRRPAHRRGPARPAARDRRRARGARRARRDRAGQLIGQLTRHRRIS